MKSMYNKTSLAGMMLKNRFIQSLIYEEFADKNGHMFANLIKSYRSLRKGVITTGML